MKKIIELKNIVKKYNNKTILKNINFSIYKGHFLSIIGPNGCGKTTLIHILSGLEQKTSGEIKKPNDLKIGFVFQNYNESLLPWKNVKDNIKLPLELSKIKDNDKIINKLIAEFELKSHINKYPFELSGGLAQLCAIARSLVNEPDVLILDEPFKSLDFDVAQGIIKLLLNYCEKKSITTILVSHDIDQAVLFADRVIILSKAPSIIKSIINIRLPRPRKFEYLQNNMFFQKKKKVLEEFQK